ncbi:MAG: glycine--tRNA ligase subunit beta [Thermoanaerobaculia bacterium]
MAELLIEILAEEIPAGVLPSSREELLRKVREAFEDARLGGTLEVHSTSRRLILVGEGIEEHQPDVSSEVVGPSAAAAYAEDGTPTRAAEGFARAHGISVDDLRVVTLPKGPYVVATKTVPGRPAVEVIAEILPPIVAKMAFPRMMRWGDGKPLWIRPVHSVVALFDGLVIPFSLFGVETSRTTYGHRTLAPARIVVTGVTDYYAKLRAAFVEPDASVRRRALAEQAGSLAAEVGGEPAKDEALLDTLAHLVEWPLLVRGSFDPSYLALPEEILVTSMREHQKVLPVRSDGALAPHFLAVADQTGDAKGYIVRGNEWVLNARFADARFFFEDDGRLRLEERLPRLGALNFQEKLGDYLRKTGRLQELAERLAGRLGLAEKAALVVQAARVAKTDLVTDMVREFPDLQGVVGGLYARRDGEPEEVWQAVYDQYKPAGVDDDVPRGDVGGLVALADRLDTLTGLFGLGLVPTGSKDPYALRRAALGVVRILLEKKWHLDLPVACSDALGLHTELPRPREEVVPELGDFLLERLRFILEKQGFRPDTIAAVLTTDCRDIADAADRVEAVEAVRAAEDFVPVSVAFKRIQNILAQAGEIEGELDPALVTEDAERALAGDYLQAKGMLDELIGERNYRAALSIMASLGPSLDRFFTEVMVLTDDPAVRANRVALLRAMRDQFFRVARFSEIQG